MKHPAATEDGVRASGNAGTPAGRPSIAQRYTSVITRTSIAASPAKVWRSLMFYEQIEESPPLHLRLLLPLPIGAKSSKLAVATR
ncbi:MAG: hypothetical protein WA446_19370 [Steroidobacteraceae bacterium]